MLEPEDGLIGIGSGGSYALAAARALADIEGLDAETIARKAMKIARGYLRLYQSQRHRGKNVVTGWFKPTADHSIVPMNSAARRS